MTGIGIYTMAAMAFFKDEAEYSLFNLEEKVKRNDISYKAFEKEIINWIIYYHEKERDNNKKIYELILSILELAKNNESESFTYNKDNKNTINALIKMLG